MAEFEHAGLKCVVRHGGFCLCGYVQPPEGFGESGDLEVHGGVTWDGEHDGIGPGRWIGFDTAHAGDYLPIPYAPAIKGKMWDEESVIEETKRLAEQIAKAVAA